MIKNQKPIDIDLHIKYECPNKKCKNEHWLSLKETKIKQFKIVCDCNIVFSPKTIEKISIRYKKLKHKKVTKKVKQKEIINIKNDCTNNVIPNDVLQKASRILQTFGFRELEANKILVDFYNKNPINDYKELVKQTLANKE